METITQSGATLTYTYDDAGNITSVSDGAKTISYEYDLLGQLTRVNDPYDATAGIAGTTWKYAYDQGGNIQSKTAYAFTTGTVGSVMKIDSYTYGDVNWKDKLTAFNGQAITYDAIGNPTTDGSWNYTWVNGRQLHCMHKGEFGEPEYNAITFEYNENGLRTKKTCAYYNNDTGTIDNKEVSYTLHGQNVVHLSDGDNHLHFFYDAQNNPAIVEFNGTAYSYLYNQQNDVIALLDSNGANVVSYAYDAWGKPISKTGTLASTLGTLNPFRYRGYVFDEETGLYYLKKRYYHASIARFINADANLNSGYVLFPNNQFCYCLNNPVMGVDYGGMATSFGYYHTMVQEHFMSSHPGVTTELGIFKYGIGSMRGRADLVNLETGEVWEVKPHMAGYIRNPVLYLNKARTQLDSYTSGIFINPKNIAKSPLRPGGAVETQSFPDPATSTWITYWSEGDGIIWYEVEKLQAPKPATAKESVPERSRSRSTSSRSVAGAAIGAVLSTLVTGLFWVMGYPVPLYAY